jgi:hypothetical protein
MTYSTVSGLAKLRPRVSTVPDALNTGEPRVY